MLSDHNQNLQCHPSLFFPSLLLLSFSLFGTTTLCDFRKTQRYPPVILFMCLATGLVWMVKKLLNVSTGFKAPQLSKIVYLLEIELECVVFDKVRCCGMWARATWMCVRLHACKWIEAPTHCAFENLKVGAARSLALHDADEYTDWCTWRQARQWQAIVLFDWAREDMMMAVPRRERVLCGLFFNYFGMCFLIKKIIILGEE